MSTLCTNDTKSCSDVLSSLQVACIDSIVHSIHDANILLGTLEYLKLIYLPPAIIDYIVIELIKVGRLTPSIFTLLAALKLDTLDFTGVDLSTAEDDLFDGFFEIENSCLQRWILDGVYLEACLFRVFATACRPLPSLSAIKNLLHLHVNNSDNLTDQYVSFFADAFPLLESLLLSGCPLLTSDAVVSITNASFTQSLKALDMSYNNASVDSMAYLTNLIVIEQLDISHMKSDESFRFIISSSRLRVLHMNGLFILEDADIKYILSGGYHPNNLLLKTLTELHLTESDISSSCLSELVHESCPITTDCLPLQQLDLSWTNENLTNSALNTLISKCNDLLDLRLQSTDARESTFLTLTSTCHHLRVLYFSRCLSDSLCLPALVSLKDLTTLNLGWAMFSSAQLDAWVDTFEHFAPALEVVGVQMFCISDRLTSMKDVS